MFIVVDGTSIEIFNWNSTTGTTNLCGDPDPFTNTYNLQYYDKIVTYSETFTHTSSTLDLELVSSLDSWTGSWGFRDFSIVLAPCPKSCFTCTNISICETCDTAAGLTLVGAECECTAGLMRVADFPCTSASCVSCISPPTCPNGLYFFGLF